jgi:BASS family bile acid:Na+ symporter
MSNVLAWISDHLLIMVIAVVAFPLIFPQVGIHLRVLSMPLLALMVLNVSMTIKVQDLKVIKRYPLIIIWSAFLQFVPVLLFSFFLVRIFFEGNITTGQILLGSLPADISAPLMVSLVGGSTALATAMLVVQMALTPIVLPIAVSQLSGIKFQTPVSYLILELAVVIVLPVVLGILINHRFKRIRSKQQAFLGVSSLCYLCLLLIVVSTNANGIITLKSFAMVLLAAEILLNLFGYFAAYLTKLALRKGESFYPMLFIVGSKEFGISTAAARIMGLNSVVVIPSAFFAIVQMISMPVAVKIISHIKLKRKATVNQPNANGSTPN